MTSHRREPSRDLLVTARDDTLARVGGRRQAEPERSPQERLRAEFLRLQAQDDAGRGLILHTTLAGEQGPSPRMSYDT